MAPMPIKTLRTPIMVAASEGGSTKLLTVPFGGVITGCYVAKIDGHDLKYGGCEVSEEFAECHEVDGKSSTNII